MSKPKTPAKPPAKAQKAPAKAPGKPQVKPQKPPAPKTRPDAEIPRHEENRPQKIDVWFDTRDSSYWYPLAGRFVQLSKSDLAMHCRAKGLRDDLYFNNLTELDWICWDAQINRQVSYAGPLAGHRVGMKETSSGQRFLVTTEAGRVFDDLPKDTSEPDWFGAFIRELLPDGQADFFLAWLALALQSLRRGDFRPGQAVVLVGEARCGKSLLQQIITEVLGGRSADPFRYLAGDTQFNRDLAEAEHWMMEDPKSTTDMRSRREFGDNIKSATVNRLLSIHAKSKDATLTLPILRRVTLSINNEFENIARIWPIDPSVADKTFLFHCGVAVESMERFRVVRGTPSLLAETANDGEMDQAAIAATFLREVPQIRAWLLRHHTTPPATFRDDRFGVKAWHHPELLERLNSMEAWERLLQLVDMVFFETEPGDAPRGPIEIKAVDLEMRLRSSKFAFETEKILKASGMCGSYLGRLLKPHPDRISKRVLHGVTLWTINPPLN